jgi:hypothetical protein
MAGLKINVGADASQFERTMKGVKGRLSSLNVMVAGMVAFKALGASIRAAGDAMRGFMDLVKQGEQAKTEEARLRNVIRQMGLYGASADQVTDKLIEQANAAELLTGVDRASITMTQSKLATFADLAKTAGVVGGAFDRTTAAAIDLAATGFGSAESNAVMLGKALADPERGLTALRRTGTLTTAQIDKIKEAFEQSGNRAEYMANVLDAVERQVKGTAEATANGTVRMQKGFAQLREEIGKPLSDQFDRLADLLMAQLPKMKESAAAIGRGISNTISDLVQGDVSKLMAIGEFIGTVVGKGFDVGFKATMRGIGTKVFQGLDAGENAIRDFTRLNRIMGQADLGERASAANVTMTSFESRVAMREMQSQFATMMENINYDRNFRVTNQFGQTFRQAAPGEATSLRDDTGRRLIEVIERDIQSRRPSTFPTQ